VLVGEGLVEDPHILPDLDEADRTGRDEQLGLERAGGRHDLDHQALRVGGLADGGLEGRDLAGDRRPDDVGAAPMDLGHPLLRRRELDTSKNPVPWPTGVAAVVDWRRAWP
jgi:hypothetical protein